MHSQVASVSVAGSIGRILGSVLFLVATVSIPLASWYYHHHLTPFITLKQDNALLYLEGWCYAKILLGLFISSGRSRYKWIGVALAYMLAMIPLVGMMNRYYQIVGF